MDKKRFAVLLVIFLIPLVSASFQLGNLSEDIGTSYSARENINGWVNISFQDENVNSIISSNFQGSIKLLDLLNNNEADYACVLADCNSSYSFSNPSTSKSFSLNYVQEKLLGFVLSENVGQITSLSFNVSASSPISCLNPLKIDLFDDGYEWKSRKSGNEFTCTYETGKGCFNSSQSAVEGEIGNQIYCEKINLTASEKFNLGAWVKKGTSAWEDGLLKMFLYNLDGEELASCNLPSPSTSGGEIYCNVTYSNDKIQEYYVCLKSSEDIDYKIQKEDVNPCGFYGEPPGSSDKHDYYIVAKGAKFDNIGQFSYNQNEYELQGNGNLAEDIKDYITINYGDNCSDGCVIPLRLKSYASLNINLLGLSLRYAAGGIIKTADKFYDVTKTNAKLSSGFVKLDLSSSNITVPSTAGNRTFTLKLDDSVILTKDIIIESASIINSVVPTSVPAGISTKFSVDVTRAEGKNISEYRWDFGDDVLENTTKNYVMHTYFEMGSYDLTIEVEDNSGAVVSKTFTINVSSPKELINSTMSDYEKRLSNLTSQLASFPGWYKSDIESIIKVDELTSQLKILRQKYSSATSDEEYVEIMGNLSQLEIPKTIKTSSEVNSQFFVNVEEVNPNHFVDFGAGTIEAGKEEAYKKAIAAWVENNLELEISYKKISAYYDSKTDDLLSVFKLNIKPKEALDKELYIIIGSTDVKFAGEENTKEFNDGVGVKFSNIGERDLEFSVVGEDINSLVLYLSPEFSLLSLEENVTCNTNGMCEKDLGENWRNCRADCKPWGWVSVLLIILVVAALVAYILLQWWYKEKYETYLFKNRNDLYNLLNFVSNARSQGLQDREISGKLKQSGWNGEQISYVFKKMAGKAIMPFDFLKLFKRTEKIGERSLERGQTFRIS